MPILTIQEYGPFSIDQKADMRLFLKTYLAFLMAQLDGEPHESIIKSVLATTGKTESAHEEMGLVKADNLVAQNTWAKDI